MRRLIGMSAGRMCHLIGCSLIEFHFSWFIRGLQRLLQRFRKLFPDWILFCLFCSDLFKSYCSVLQTFFVAEFYFACFITSLQLMQHFRKYSLIWVFFFFLFIRCLQLLLQHRSRKPKLYNPNDLHPLCLAIHHDDTDCLKLLIFSGFKPDQMFYDDQNYCGTLLCFSPSFQAAKYILEQGLDLTKELKYVHGIMRNRLNPVVASLDARGDNSMLTNLLLVHGARIEDSEKCWQQIMMKSIISDCLEFRYISVFYFMIKCECEMKKGFAFLQKILPRFLPRCLNGRIKATYYGVVSLFMLLTPNIKLQETLMDKQLYPEANRVIRQIEGEYGPTYLQRSPTGEWEIDLCSQVVFIQSVRFSDSFQSVSRG